MIWIFFFSFFSSLLLPRFSLSQWLIGTSVTSLGLSFLLCRVGTAGTDGIP